MRFSTIRHAFENQAARGNLRDEHVPLMQAVTIAELAVEAFGRAYYQNTWDKASEEVQARRASEAAQSGVDNLIRKWEARARDLAPLSATLARETILTTLDLPAVLGRARDLALQDAEEPVSTESALFAGSNKTSRPDFRERPTLKRELDLIGLFPQPEGTNVRYEAFGFTEDKSAVAKFSRAIGWTYEARVNDDLGGFLDQAAALGYAARLNRLRVLFAAIIASAPRTVLGGSAGGPTIERVEAARDMLAQSRPARRMGQVSVPVNWEGLATAARDNQFIPASNPAELNPVYQAFTVNVEELMPEVLEAANGGSALDWLAHDPNIGTWLDFHTLNGYEGGPRIAFKLPDVRDNLDMGSFDNMTDAMKVVDVVGAKVTDETRVIRVAGE